MKRIRYFGVGVRFLPEPSFQTIGSAIIIGLPMRLRMCLAGEEPRGISVGYTCRWCAPHRSRQQFLQRPGYEPGLMYLCKSQ
jgi:hypothetical protein